MYFIDAQCFLYFEMNSVTSQSVKGLFIWAFKWQVLLYTPKSISLNIEDHKIYFKFLKNKLNCHIQKHSDILPTLLTLITNQIT